MCLHHLSSNSIVNQTICWNEKKVREHFSFEGILGQAPALMILFMLCWLDLKWGWWCQQVERARLKVMQRNLGGSLCSAATQWAQGRKKNTNNKQTACLAAFVRQTQGLTEGSVLQFSSGLFCLNSANSYANLFILVFQTEKPGLPLYRIAIVNYEWYKDTGFEEQGRWHVSYC